MTATTTDSKMLHIFGIRHHGPGCARSLVRALDELRPDVIVLESPADGQDAINFASSEQMVPPVALLIHQADQPSRAVYLPFALFSPEWQALKWGIAHGVPIRLMDLPMSLQFGLEKEQPSEDQSIEPKDHPEEPQEEQVAETSPSTDPSAEGWRVDPLALLAEAAGYKDHELWWEEQVERREDPTDLFAAILEAMRTIRDEIPSTLDRDLQREAFMRKTLREVRQEGFQTIAVVCGAWHSPVLDEDAVTGKREGLRVKDDNERLKGLTKVKTSSTWIPWTYSRMTYRSGYGAGVQSPGWYGHLWESPREAPNRWLVTAARLLRERDLDASSASVIEASRLADALAALRDLRSPGLAELNESILSILCHGEIAPLALIRNRLEIGHVLGCVPPETPTVPLAQDLAKLQTKLRFKPSTEIKEFDFDLRKETDLARSQLLHRLSLLEIPWGSLQRSGGRSSTFHEIWSVEWKPEFAVGLIEANVWGNTVESAATAKVIQLATDAQELAGVTGLLDSAILAGLSEAVDPLLQRVQTIAAVGANLRHLMDALPPLARIARYGDVRGTQAEHVEPILVSLFERIVVGLPTACSALDDDAAQRMLESMAFVTEALQLLNREDLKNEWHDSLSRIKESPVHPLLRGWCCRSLLEHQVLSDEELYRLARLALSPALPSIDCANWATGLLRGSGLVLLHQDGVWKVFDRWLSELNETVFVEMLPLLRRAFADFTGPERRQMGEKIKQLDQSADSSSSHSGGSSPELQVDHRRAARILPVLAQILGVKLEKD